MVSKLLNTQTNIDKISNVSEINLSVQVDLDLFRSSVEKIFSTAMKFQVRAAGENFVSLSSEEVDGKRIFTILNIKYTSLLEMLELCQIQLLSHDSDVSDNLIIDMQNLYDEMIILRDYILDAYENTVSAFTLSKKGKRYEILHSDVDQSNFELENDEPEAPLTLFSELIPMPGTDGLRQARFLREAAMIARDKHPALKNQTHKQVLVDKLIRKLADLPSIGLSVKEDIPELINLAEQIAVPEQFLDEKPTCDSQSEDVLSKLSFKKVPKILRKTMVISSSDEAGTGELVIKVNSSKNKNSTNKVLDMNTVSAIAQSKPAFIADSHSTVDKKPVKANQGVASEIESIDPVNRIIHSPLTKIARTKSVHKKRNLTHDFLGVEPYKTFILLNYSSMTSFEHMLDSTLSQIEFTTVNTLDRWIGVKQRSPFEYIQNMTVSDFQKLLHSRNLREILIKEDVKYESFLTWVDLLPEMKKVAGKAEDITIAELYCKWIIEIIMLEKNSSIN